LVTSKKGTFSFPFRTNIGFELQENLKVLLFYFEAIHFLQLFVKLNLYLNKTTLVNLNKRTALGGLVLPQIEKKVARIVKRARNCEKSLFFK
jgi:hypothetical protein